MSSQNLNGYLQSLSLLHGAFFAGILLFAITAYALVRLQILGEVNQDLDMIFQFIVPTYMVLAVVGSRFLRTYQLNATQKLADLNEKFEKYRNALVINFAFLEGAALLAIVAYIVTQNFLYLSLALLILLAFLINRPSLEKISKDLKLSETDKMKLS